MVNRRALLTTATGMAACVGMRDAFADQWVGDPGADEVVPPPEGTRHTGLVMIPTRDGTRIAASLWLPPDPGEYPVILMRSLNRRVYSSPERLSIVGELLRAGYGFLATEVRGRFESDGEFDPADPKDLNGRDGYDIIEWIADQPWCDGAVGTFGASHQAGYQVAAALLHPPHLKAMATWTGGYRESGLVAGAPPPLAGGAIPLIQTLVWLPNEAAGELDRLAREGRDTAEARKVLARVRSHPQETYLHLPLREAPIARYGRLRELLDYRLKRGTEPRLGPGTAYEKIRVPAMHECGWYDPIAWTQFSAFADLRERAGTDRAREGQHIVAGPWHHSTVLRRHLGEMDFGVQASQQGSGVNRLQIAFFDRYVRGMNVALPRVRYFVMGPNEWRTAESWPPPGMTRRRLYLHSGSGANGVAGDGALSSEPPARPGTDRFDYDPENPVPTLGGAIIGGLNVAGMQAGPMNQAEVEARRDVLIYTSAPFAADTEISGPVTLKLFASTSAVDTDFTAKLTHVLPNGESVNLCECLLRLSGRNFTGEPEPATPGEVYELTLGVGQTSVVIAQGHRLRLQVSSSNFPQFDRNMNTGHAIGVDAKGVVARQTVYHGPERRSRLELPMAELTQPRHVSDARTVAASQSITRARLSPPWK